eukprot:131140_1
MQKTMTNWSHLRTKLNTQLIQSLVHSHKTGKLLPSIRNPRPLNTSQQLRERTEHHSILHESIANIIHNFNDHQDIENKQRYKRFNPRNKQNMNNNQVFNMKRFEFEYEDVDSKDYLHDDDKTLTIPTVLQRIFDQCTLQYHSHHNIGCVSDAVLDMLESKQQCLVELVDIDDNEESSVMRDIVRHIGRTHIHDKEESVLWDVKPGHGELARSHGDQPFELHTDASFDKVVPRYLGLHFIKHDRFGGGLNQLISVEDVVNKLEPSEVDFLLKHKFQIRIPLEFRKNDDVECIHGAILGYDHVLGRYIMRYRRDIIETNDLDQETLMVLKTLERALDEVQQDAMFIQIPENHILFADNCCLLHSRTEIKDRDRHLRRIRFHPKQSELLPKF